MWVKSEGNRSAWLIVKAFELYKNPWAGANRGGACCGWCFDRANLVQCRYQAIGGRDGDQKGREEAMQCPGKRCYRLRQVWEEQGGDTRLDTDAILKVENWDFLMD